MNKSINGCWCNDRHKLLYPILRKWILINSLFAERDNGQGSWGDTERSSVGILAAAIWKSNNICFEEYHSEKRRDSNKGKYKGRVDIWFGVKKVEYIGEAKRCYPDASIKNAIKLLEDIKKVQSWAVWDAKKIKAKINTRKIGIIFITPMFKLDKDNYTVEGFVNKITTEIDCDAIAWVFPKISRDKNVYNKISYPGAFVVIKEA